MMGRSAGGGVRSHGRRSSFAVDRFRRRRFSYRRLAESVDAARECGFAAISANDHFLFSAPWLDGPTALAAVAERSGGMKLVTTLALASLRGPVPLARAFSALDILSGGRVIAGVGPGSSKADYEAVGVPFEQRWQRFDEAARLLKALLQPGPAADSRTSGSAALPGLAPAPRQRRGVPLWIGSWGSQAGLRRVASLADGWLASAYNTTPEALAAAMKLLGRELERQARPTADFPNALVTMWVWITDKRSDAERVLSGVVGPLVKRTRRSFAAGSASARRTNARSCFPGTPEQAASASTSGR
jgi:alkanesulfonate monooxygenase SsuD/methylene tetrahydromethanopterin reductase-like flavin-dependent oxidoreductase (luciferase family)